MDNARERKLTNLWLELAFVAEQNLYAVELIESYHRFVCALVLLSAVTNDSTIELVVEHLVDHTVRQ